MIAVIHPDSSGDGSRRLGASGEGVQQGNSGHGKVAGIPGYDGQVVREGGGGDHAVPKRHRESPASQTGEESHPLETRLPVPREARHPAGALLEPDLKPLPPRPSRQDQDPISKLPKDDRINRRFPALGPKPLFDRGGRQRPRQFAQDIRVDKPLHLMSAVVSLKLGALK